MVARAFLMDVPRPTVAASSGVGVLKLCRLGRSRHPAVFSTGFVNGHAFAVIFPIAMLVTPSGAQLAHRLNTRQLEMGFAVFLLFVSGRCLGVWWGELGGYGGPGGSAHHFSRARVSGMLGGHFAPLCPYCCFAK
jgi:uncharacterized membrane protein YfcA